MKIIGKCYQKRIIKNGFGFIELASSKLILCFRKFSFALFLFHSNISSVSNNLQ